MTIAMPPHAAAPAQCSTFASNGSQPGEPYLLVSLGTGTSVLLVDGMSVGENKTVTIQPEEAYGERHEQLVQEVPKSALPDEIDPAVGMHLQSRSPEGQVLNLVVTDVADDSITVDGNHPLAGQALTFDIELVEIV